ncbi:c-type cytochrome domain-containing protein [Leptospira sp. WS92.C1]
MYEIRKVTFSFLLIALSTFLFFVACQDKKSSDQEDDLKTLAFLLNSNTPLDPLSAADCTVPAPTFLSLNQATTTCASCHNPGNANAGFDITSYASVLNRVVVNQPNSSLIFQKINSGSMRGFNNNSINKAVFCWIQNGANP